MLLREAKVSVELEIMEGQGLEPPMDNLADGQDVTVTLTDESGPNGNPMARISGTVPQVILWLNTVYGMDNEDIIDDMLNWQVEDLLPTS